MATLSAIDTERFGIVTARAPHVTEENLEATLRFCRENRVQMLIARCPCAQLLTAQAMESAGARLMDTLVYWVRPLAAPLPEVPALPVVRPMAPGEASEVTRVAAACFRSYFGHYHADARLDRAACDATYASWAERSCTEPSVASTVLVAEHEGRVAGFLTLLERGAQEQEIMLNGVDPALQRQGLYRALVVAALHRAHADGAVRVSVSTQLANNAVQKTWARLGFEPLGAEYTFHLWF